MKQFIIFLLFFLVSIFIKSQEIDERVQEIDNYISFIDTLKTNTEYRGLCSHGYSKHGGWTDTDIYTVKDPKDPFPYLETLLKRTHTESKRKYQTQQTSYFTRDSLLCYYKEVRLKGNKSNKKDTLICYVDKYGNPIKLEANGSFKKIDIPKYIKEIIQRFRTK